MAKQTINVGSTADDGTGSTIRAGGQIVNANFDEIYSTFGDTTNLSSTVLTIVDESSTESTISFGERLSITGGANLTSTVSGDSINVTLNTTITGLTSVQTETLTNASGNLLVDSATKILEIRGDGASIVGQLQLNCHVNTHGQIVASQPHSESATNTLTLPGGSTIGNSDATLLSDTGTQTISNKTIGVTQLTGNTRTATGDGSTTTFTVTDGTTTNNTLVFVSGSITTDYTISGTTLTFGSPPTGSAAIVIKEL